MKPPGRLAVILTCICGTMATAQSDDICSRLGALMDSAASGAAAEFTHDTTVGCTRSLNLGGAASVDCAWGFDYRAPVATETFERLLAQVGRCGEPLAQTGPNVSHPDSYDLRQFQMGEGVISVSLKDKGALGQTYIFLRAQSRSLP